jgi:hypothetical protein
MSESNIEKARSPERRETPSRTPAEIFEELRQEFAPMARRLTPDVEPAVVFRLEPYERETAS